MSKLGKAGAKDACDSVGMTETHCSDTEWKSQDISDSYLSSLQYGTPCCHNAPSSTAQVWNHDTSYAPIFKDIGSAIWLYNLGFGDWNTALKNCIKDSSCSNKLLFSGNTAPSISSDQRSSINTNAEDLGKLWYLNQVFNTNAASAFPFTSFGFLTATSAMGVIFFVFSIANFTFFSRQGFARVNVFLGGALFAMTLISYWTVTRAVHVYLPLMTRCSEVSSQNQPLWEPLSFYARGSDQANAGPALLGWYPCYDYSCQHGTSGNQQSCERGDNPFTSRVFNNFLVFIDGLWVMFVGIIFTVGALANISDISKAGDGELSVNSPSYTMGER